jgi:hypothetical protein
MACLFVVILYCPRAHGQCSGVCGDVNQSGGISSPDLFAMLIYSRKANWAIAADTNCANVDGYPGITMRDLCILGDEIFYLWAEPDCDLETTGYVPMPNAGYFLNFNSVFPPFDSAVTLHFDLTMPGLPQRTMGVELCMRIRVDGADVTIGNITPPPVEDPPDWWYQSLFKQDSANIPPGHLLGSYVKWEPGGAVFGRHYMGSAQILTPPVDSYRVITVEFVEMPVSGQNTSMAVQDVTYDGWAINFDSWIIDRTGDANNDRSLTSADIILLVNYVFKSGHSPYPVPAAGDVNCSGGTTSADIIALVNHVFKGGPGPCDVTAECAVNLESWTCP